jgi:hypothetical protein
MEWVRSKYDYGQTLAVMANDDDGSPYGVATVYLEGQSESLPRDCAFVDTNNWPDVVELLESEGIAEELDEVCGFSGFCTYSAMKFNLEKIRELK